VPESGTLSNKRRADSPRRWLTARRSVVLAITGVLVIAGLIIAVDVLPAASDRTPSELTPPTIDGASEYQGIQVEPGNDPRVQL
jgi:hypothetical protein